MGQEDVMEYTYEDYFNPTWFRDEPFIQERFEYGDIDIILSGIPWITVQTGAAYTRIGHTLWAAGHILADYLLHNQIILQGKRILELGCGLGLTGLVVSKLIDNPSKVVLTDGDSNILDALQLNIETNFPNSFSVIGQDNHVQFSGPFCDVLYWGENVKRFKEKYGEFDLIIGADVLYTENSIGPLLDTVTTLMNHEKGSKLLLAFQLKYGGRLKESLLQMANRCHLIAIQVNWKSQETRLLDFSHEEEDCVVELWEFYRDVC